MRAMILAAGRGQRMGELTAHTPKPLLTVGKHYLIEHAILNLKKAGINDIVINVSYLGDQIKQALGNGQQYGVTISYSEEIERLETGGGIYKALPLLGNEPFIVISSDILTNYSFAKLKTLAPGSLAHLVLIDNPSYHLEGDFGLSDQRVSLLAQPKKTYANIGLYDANLFANCEPGHFKLSEVLFPAIKANKITGEIYQGLWYNIGTPEELKLATSSSVSTP